MADSCVIQPLFVNSQSQPVFINEDQDEVFNYELVHLRYSEACEDYFENPKSVSGPWTQKARTYLISFIKANNVVLPLTNLLYDLEPNVLEKYQIVLEDEEEKLVLTGTATEVLPYEECFDIFVELHLKTAHGGFESILKKLENVFLVHDMCLKIFLMNCNIYKKISLQKVNPVTFNDCISIEILKAPIQDYECRFILFYIDNVTTYTLFRPLIAMDEYEISIEMLKIFTDFGPPIVIKTIHAPLFNNVLTILERGGFHYDISIDASDKVIGESYYLMQQIVARNNEDRNFWSTICRFIQFKHNNGQLPLRDPILNKVVHAGVKPFNQVFFTKHLPKKVIVSEKQTVVENNNKNTSNTSVTLSNRGHDIDKYVISSESSETDTASETEECQSILAMEIEEKLNVIKDVNLQKDEQSLCNPTTSNMDNETSNEIKVEFNPIETATHSRTSVQNLCEAKIEEVDNVARKTPLIIDNIPVKNEKVLEESLVPSSSGSATEALPVLSLGTNLEIVTEHNFSEEILHANNKKKQMKNTKDYVCCSVCNGKMLTDYFCFGCKKNTHIFCLTRVTTPLEKVTDTVTSFTYCEPCLKAKYNLSNAIKINE